MRLNLTQMTLPLPVNASDNEVAKATADAQKAMTGVRTCSDLHSRSRELKGATSGDLSGVRVGDLQANQQMFEQIPKLTVGGTAGRSRSPRGCRSWRCAARSAPTDCRRATPSPSRSCCRSSKAAGRRYMRDLRRQATIDVKAAMTAAAPLAVTMGEPAGIGGELSLKAWSMRRQGDRPFFVLDDASRLAALAGKLGLDVPVRELDRPAEAGHVFATALPVLPVRLRAPVKAGQPDPANAPATLEAIERAVELALAGEIAGMVTNPIQKKTLQDAGFRHPGHTEYLAELAGGVDVAMMLACPELRVVPVTIHLSLAEAVRVLDSDKIVRAGRLAATGLKILFGIERPRLAVAALNPHAGEQGSMGDEEGRVDRARDRGAEARRHRCAGPAPADTLFHAGARAGYDAVLCMYHDQALIPIKTVDFAGGVNVTLGLPFVRTSPDHGTALDIVGTGRADPTSLIAGLRMADDMARRRRS